MLEREPGCHLGERGRDAGVEVRPTEGQPVLQGRGVVRVGPGRPLLQARRRRAASGRRQRARR